MKRYLKLYPLYVSKSIKARLSYKLDAFVGIFGFLLENALSFLALYWTVSSIPSLDGWSIEMMAFLYGYCQIPRAIDHIFSDQIWMLGGGGITRGMLDKYLIKPLNPLFQLVAEMVQLEGLGELIIGIAFVSIFAPMLSINWTFMSVFLLVIWAFFGIFFYFGIKLLFGSLAFWTKRSIEVMNLFYGFSQFARYPLEIFNRFIRVILTFIIPFSVVIYMPIRALLFNENLLLVTGYVILVSLAMLGLSLFVWHRGLRKYESAGS